MDSEHTKLLWYIAIELNILIELKIAVESNIANWDGYSIQTWKCKQ